MKTHQTLPRLLGTFAIHVGICSMLAASFPTAAQTTIEQAPLSVSKAIPPNILYVLDDSGSMQFEYMPEAMLRADLSRNRASLTACQNASMTSVGENDGQYLFPHDSATIYGKTPYPDTPAADDPQSIRAVHMRSPMVNTIYYNPYVRYQPWIDASSVSTATPTRYPNATATAARYNPYGTTSTKTLDLTAAHTPSKQWLREPSSGAGWCKDAVATSRNFYPVTFYLLKTGGDTSKLSDFVRYQYRPSAGSGSFHALDLATGLETTLSSPPWTTGTWSQTEELQNFANWFSYYRSRVLAARGGTGEAFVGLDPTYRVGYSVISRTGSTGTSFPLIGTTGGFAGTPKQTWYEHLYSGQGADFRSGTPLRKALENAGTYYETADPWGAVSCRASVTMLMTDGVWNSAAQSSTYRNADNEPGDTITGLIGDKQASFSYSPVNPFADATADTLADVALGFWKKDLQSNLKNNVPPTNNNPAFWQHMITMTVGLGVTPTGIKLDGQLYEQPDVADKIFSMLCDPATDKSCNQSRYAVEWPPAAADSANNTADLLHAAVNGRGTFVSALNPQQFEAGVKGALESITPTRPGSGASLAANSTRLEEGTLVFQAEYRRNEQGIWSGDLSAYSVEKTSGIASEVKKWSAAERLDTRDFVASPRSVFFHAPGNSTPIQVFSLSNLSSTQKDKLGADSRQPTKLAELVDYIRGDRSNEANGSNTGLFRQRSSLLGSIVHSQPVYVGAPRATAYTTATFNGSVDYSTFAAGSAKTRIPLVYVQANDGMLHAFYANADTNNTVRAGDEAFAFIPNAVIMNSLGVFADPAIDHRYHLDGEITVADAYDSTLGWRTILVGTLGRAGRGIYALDITDPSAIKLLWEHDATSLPEIGNVLGKPVIAQIANGTWSVIFGNGPNNTGGQARLIMLSAFTGVKTVVSVGTGTNGYLSAPYTWDQDNNGFFETVYVGTAHDAGGSLWRITNLSGSPSLRQIFSTQTGQKVTAAPVVAKNPSTGDVWAFFGTGQYLNLVDLADTTKQSWYGIIDDWKNTGTAPDVRLDRNGKSDLVKRLITAEGTVGNFAVRAISTAADKDMSNMKGWYIDLMPPNSTSSIGERMVVPNVIQGRTLIGTTRIPDASDPCDLTGSGFVMAIDPFTGAALPRTFFDLNGDRLFTQADMMMVNGKLTIVSGIGFKASPNSPIFIENAMQVSLDDASKKTVSTQGGSATPGRTAWREIRRLGE
ncbi:MAG: pilus assembly protein [Thauera sp.]